MVLGLEPTGKLDTLKTKPKCLIEPRPCMVLGLKPLGKLDTLKTKAKC